MRPMIRPLISCWANCWRTAMGSIGESTRRGAGENPGPRGVRLVLLLHVGLELAVFDHKLDRVLDHIAVLVESVDAGHTFQALKGGEVFHDSRPVRPALLDPRSHDHQGVIAEGPVRPRILLVLL